MSSSPFRSVKRPPAETRNLMLQTISELLETRAPWDIRASEVAAAAGTTQPNFYSHFRNIEDAITARAQQVWALYPTARLAELLVQGLRGGDEESIRSFFALTIEFWSRHAGLLRAVSRLPGDEHPAIRDIRHAAQDPILHLCQAAIIEGQACDTLAAEWHPGWVPMPRCAFWMRRPATTRPCATPASSPMTIF
ncbi:TetR/AcrR family transcriptional regulator [Pseudomonas lopnurensis]|uniref:TetR/AcrR family transcriptional regulator n=1 Tax=Pseudomonas lopnurensis TaxID=1477517 RepID=UPI0028A5922A|nr:TetR/AcrR family transcriptional regulator [Pseudomonas lopnurensis]